MINFLFLLNLSIIKNPIWRYVARACYDGTHFFGWQKLNSKRSCQGELCSVFSQILQYDVNVCGASRTDAGVHANGQVFHFDSPVLVHSLEACTDQINLILPDDLKIYDLKVAPKGLLAIQQLNDDLKFHSMLNAKSKHYSYRLGVGNFLYPFQRHNIGLMSPKTYQFDANLFNSTLQMFVGTHDFSSFTNKLDQRINQTEAYSGKDFSPTRTVFNASFIEEDSIFQTKYIQRKLSDSSFRNQKTLLLLPDSRVYRVDIMIDGAMYKMIRNIVGACYGVAIGKITSNDVQKWLLFPSNRALTCIVTVPACGLTLENVFYDEVF